MLRSKIEKLSGFSKYKIIRFLNKLIEENIIEKVGMRVDIRYGR